MNRLRVSARLAVLCVLAVAAGGCAPRSAPDAGEKPEARPGPAQAGAVAESPSAQEAAPAAEKPGVEPDAPSKPEPGLAGEKAPTEEEAAPKTGPGKDDGDDAFSLEEIEKRRKLIEEEMAKQEAEWREKQKQRIAELGPPLIENAGKLVRLDPVFPVWADRENKRVVMVGEVCKREGPLEMFACLRRTKEHESIVVVDTRAQVVHAGLLAVGAKQGTPVRYDPEYRAATGDEIEVTVSWKDKQGKVQTARAQDWVRHGGTKKAMEHPWVFAGSMLYKDEVTGETRYMADGGDFVCVSNFGTAMLDLPVQSSSLNRELEFEAFTDRIPDEGTPVTLIMAPKKKPAEKDKPVPKEKEGEKEKPV